jgi:hypothetical protein
MSTSKARSLAVFIPSGAVLVLSAVLAAPGMSAMPTAYATLVECKSGEYCPPPDPCKEYDKNCPPDNGEKNEKVTICHIPPGNPDNAHTIRVSENAVDAHLAHGDTLGECQKNY